MDCDKIYNKDDCDSPCIWNNVNDMYERCMREGKKKEIDDLLKNSNDNKINHPLLKGIWYYNILFYIVIVLFVSKIYIFFKYGLVHDDPFNAFAWLFIDICFILIMRFIYRPLYRFYPHLKGAWPENSLAPWNIPDITNKENKIYEYVVDDNNFYDCLAFYQKNSPSVNYTPDDAPSFCPSTDIYDKLKHKGNSVSIKFFFRLVLVIVTIYSIFGLWLIVFPEHFEEMSGSHLEGTEGP